MKMEQILEQVTLDEKRRTADTTIYYLDRIVDEIEKGYFCIFAGAGLSAASGYVDWKTLLEPMGKQLGLNMNMDLTLLAQYYENKFTRDELNRRILDEFAKIPENNKNMEILASMPISRYWTTNYDSIIEDTLKKQNKTVDVIIDQLQIKYHSPLRDAIVYKMHGDKTLPDKAVLCKNDYETYDETRSIFTQSLMLDMINNTFLFIGFSFSDPNLDRIIAIVKRSYNGASPKKHYCFLRKVNVADYIKDIQKDENLHRKKIEQFEEDSCAQDCKVHNMRRYGIETILVDDFDQITQMLEYIRDKLKLKTIFISGATDPNNPSNFGDFQKDNGAGVLKRAEKFIMQLSNKLIQQQYNIVTGFGVGVGNYVVAGAYALKSNSNTRIDDRIHIQPMISIEQDILNKTEKDKLREDLLDKCGIVITIFGKTLYTNNTPDFAWDDDGTYAEYRLAHRKEKIIIPIGATGFTSKKIYELEKRTWNDHSQIYEALGNDKLSNDELITNIVDAIKVKRNAREEEMRNKLIYNIFDKPSTTKVDNLSTRNIFISFHYDSTINIAQAIVEIINNSTNYQATTEAAKKTDDTQIQNWIDEKMDKIAATIVLFNDQFASRKWTEYEIEKSISMKVPLLFLLKKDISKECLSDYIKQHKIKDSMYKTLIWETENDFTKIVPYLDTLLHS